MALYTYSKVITTPDSKRRSRKAPGDECHRYLSKTLSSHLLILILRHLCKSYLLLILPYLDPVLPLFKCDALRTAHARVRNGPGKAWTAFDLSPPTGHSLHSSVRKKTANLRLGHESIHSIGSDSLRHFVRLGSRCAGENLRWVIGNHMLIYG